MQGFLWYLKIKGVAARAEARPPVHPRSELIDFGEGWCEGALVGIVDALVVGAGGGRVKVVFLEVLEAALA